MSLDVPIEPPIRVGGNAAGRATPGGGIDIPVYYPGTGAQVSTLTEDDAASVDIAVKAARKAFDTGPWPGLSVAARQFFRLRRVGVGHLDGHLPVGEGVHAQVHHPPAAHAEADGEADETELVALTGHARDSSE